MIVGFEDPHWDWTPWLYAAGAVAVVFIIYGVLFLISRYGDPRAHKEAKNFGWLNVLSIIAVLSLPAALAFSIGASVSIYNGMMGEAKRVMLEDAGFEDIDFALSDYDSGEDFMAVKDGEVFIGELVYLHPHRDYKYQVVEYQR